MAAWASIATSRTSWTKAEKFKVEKKPLWVRIERNGSQFTFSALSDGQSWKTTAVREIAMDANIYAGLVVCSHHGKLNEGKFDHITTNTPTGAWTASDIGI